MEQRPPLHLGEVAIEKGAFGSPSTMVANFTYLQISKTKSANQLEFFGWKTNMFLNEITKSDLKQQLFTSPPTQKKTIKLDNFWKNSKENDLRVHFWELLDELQGGTIKLSS